jgi:acyl dehydratase
MGFNMKLAGAPSRAYPHGGNYVMADTIRFDDVEALRAKMSKDFGSWSEPIEITQQKINQFADVTGDHQWIHIDVERCKKESPFGGPVAHGFLTLSLLPAFHGGDGYHITGSRNMVNYGANKLRFISPVPAGASVHARSRIIAVDPRPQGTMITRETEVCVVGQERPALLYEGLTLYVK